MREVLYGRNPVYEALRARRRRVYRLWIAEGIQIKGNLRAAVRMAEERRIPHQRAPRRRLDALVGHSHHQGVALEVGPYPYTDVGEMLALATRRKEPPFLLLLDTLQDPQNLATLLRTAEAVGVHGVLLPLRRTATVTPAVVNASSGATEHLLIGQTNLAQAIETLQARGVWVVGLEGSDEALPPEQISLAGALALVVGSEGQGLRRLVRRKCDALLRLPMRGKIESLNAAVAGSVALYLAWQQRGWA
ncbi:MAG: 23S rRNA (guanosine(2251)-2'-O)-methyltransferase RlmB [Chloroflexi bacterium]|nr:23S rRNA (guanosine(2251)-2'-O)-methyltransferase RlmB [Chloroflexota bacterium]